MSQARPLAGFDEQFDQPAVTCASKGFGHLPVGGIEEADPPRKPDGKLSENLIFLVGVARDDASNLWEMAMTLWFTADHHFGHANIIRFCNRPFADVAEMEEGLVERWNATVGVSDEVWHLGDFAYRCGPNRLKEIFGRLHGRAIHLVRGNHDRKATLALSWATVQHFAELVVDGRTLVLFHYPFRVRIKSCKECVCIHAHSLMSVSNTPESCDVGVDDWDFRPVSLDAILRKVEAGIPPPERPREAMDRIGN